MSERTGLRPNFDGYFVSLPVFLSVYRVKYPRREWWLYCSSLSRKITQSFQRALAYCCRTILLADNQLDKEKKQTFSALKRIGPFGVYGPRYRHAAEAGNIVKFLFKENFKIMLVLIHTLTMTVADIEVSAKFFHVMCSPNRRLNQGVTIKRLGVSWHRNKVVCGRKKFRSGQPQLRQNLQALLIGALQNVNGKPAHEDQLKANNIIKTSLSPQIQELSDRPNNYDNALVPQAALIGSATPQQTMTWLQTNRFAAYLHTFASFSGADLMRLSRDDLIQICGLADGIRLFNALHPKAKTLYICVQNSPVVYQAVYLASLSSREMCLKVAALMGLSLGQLTHVYMQGPNGIHVIITDELVRNIKDESTYTTELISDQSGEGLCLLLKPQLQH